MNREDIIRLMNEAAETIDHTNLLPFFERFAALVAAAEREACAKLCREAKEVMWHSWDSDADPLDRGGAITAAYLAAAIRKRGEK